MALGRSEVCVFFYEGRTVRGLGVMSWSLAIQLGAVVATGVTLAVLAALLGPALLNPSGLVPAILGVVVAVCGIELAEVAVGILFLVGFLDVHKGRNEYGLSHARAIDRATACIVAFAGLTLFSTIYSISLSLFSPTAAAIPTESVLTGNLLLSPLGALIAGLGLFYSVRTLVDASQRGRLRAAIALGVAGTVVGPALLAFPAAINPGQVSAVVTGMLASSVAGDGLCALSLLLFALTLRDVRRSLVSGTPAPSLPPYAPAYPWAWPVPPTETIPPGQGRGPER